MSGISVLTRIGGVLLALFTLPLTLAGITAGVLWLDGGSASFRHTYAVSVGDHPTVTVDGVAGGVVTVTQGPAREVTVVDTSTVHALSRSVARDVDRNVTTTLSATPQGAAVQLDWFHSFGIATNETRVVTVSVPAGSSLRLSGSAEVVHLDHVNGPVDFNGSYGLVVLKDFTITGSSTMYLVGGAIAGTATMAGGSLNAQVINGGIKLVLASADGTRVEASAGNGSVQVPPDSGLALHHSGSLTSAEGVIGGGPATAGSLVLNTFNGVISLSMR